MDLAVIPKFSNCMKNFGDNVDSDIHSTPDFMLYMSFLRIKTKNKTLLSLSQNFDSDTYLCKNSSP